jgi:Flp pilus assembly protein TadG
LVILTPILIMLVFLAVQAALYFHAANVASAAAAQGAAAGSRVNSSAAAANAAINQTLQDLGSRPAGTPIVQISASEIVVTVEVSVSQIVPFFPKSVSRIAQEPLEQFIPESER